MPHDSYKALYIHLPFCKHRCAYCDFATRAVDRDSPEIGEYIERLILDIRRKAKEGELSAIETVYLGGGTPSYIGSKHLSNPAVHARGFHGLDARCGMLHGGEP